MLRKRQSFPHTRPPHRPLRGRRKPAARSADSSIAGLAVVELAVCLPILVVILLATIETCTMLQMQQNLAVAAYEGARVGIIPGVEGGTVQMQCQMLLDDRNVNGYTITMAPADPTTMVPGDNFAVTIAADCTANSLVGSVFYNGKTITESVVMKAE